MCFVCASEVSCPRERKSTRPALVLHLRGSGLETGTGGEAETPPRRLLSPVFSSFFSFFFGGQTGGDRCVWGEAAPLRCMALFWASQKVHSTFFFLVPHFEVFFFGTRSSFALGVSRVSLSSTKKMTKLRAPAAPPATRHSASLPKQPAATLSLS